MQAEFMYYAMSIVTPFSLLGHIANMLYYRAKQKPLFSSLGNKLGGIEHARLVKYSSKRYVRLAAFLLLLSIVNLAVEVYTILHMYTADGARFILIGGAAFVVILTVCIFVDLYNRELNAGATHRSDDW